ncbi:hypothetical protein [Mycobacterium intracellulare]|uniref:Uncharacterized protein n=1 Tax=Mycobacterium intracellulare TaxID=1767 RepID=A0A7R7MYV8_MYCIT|nr:hypothetical protein [Mycobacterium intracellulare]BCP02490.1 hypothetical protein MINTM018_52590 [Mycobacterium intracellulare]
MEITINIAKWSRYDEVKGFAEKYGISVEQAIEQLVNAGLSYESL